MYYGRKKVWAGLVPCLLFSLFLLFSFSFSLPSSPAVALLLPASRPVYGVASQAPRHWKGSEGEGAP